MNHLVKKCKGQWLIHLSNICPVTEDSIWFLFSSSSRNSHQHKAQIETAGKYHLIHREEKYDPHKGDRRSLGWFLGHQENLYCHVLSVALNSSKWMKSRIMLTQHVKNYSLLENHFFFREISHIDVENPLSSWRWKKDICVKSGSARSSRCPKLPAWIASR